jgi:histidinol dehydrogenase
MPLFRILGSSELSPEARRALMRRSYAEDISALESVRSIVEDVRSRRAEAVLEYTKRFDGVELDGLTVDRAEFDRAEKMVDPALKRAFMKAAENITRFHVLQRGELRDMETVIHGTKIGYRYVPMNSAGVYVPGGKALYPSSVLMGVIPATLAGIRNPLLITPPAPDGSVHPVVLFCAKLAGTDRVLKSGGAQGIAAAAFGVASEPVEIIVGPGNRYVTGAKSLLSAEGVIRMDMPAGPSEVVIIADRTARPAFVAADMLSQAEHGEDSPAVLLTDSRELAEEVGRELVRGIEHRPQRRSMKEASIRNHSFAVVFEDLSEAFAFSNEYGPEHLEICTEDPASDLKRITAAGSVFLGNYAPVALGDYYSGTNHVLPTGAMARFYSGLGVETFMKRITYQHPTHESLREARDPILLMSAAEGFDHEHGHSVAVRFE